MLPNFSLLRLDHGAHTGGFYNLTPDEVDDLNERQEQDPITLEDFVSVFRVTVRNPDGSETHKHYNAKALWQSIQSTFAANGRLQYPGLQTPVWREDWYELHNQYDPTGPVPPEVAQLSRLDGSVGDDTESEEWDFASDDESGEEEYGPEEAAFFMNQLRQRYDVAREYPARDRWDELQDTVRDIIEHCSNEGGQEFQNAFQDLMVDDNETFFKNALARTAPNDMLLNGILIELLDWLVLEEDTIRDMVRRWGVREDVRRFAAHANSNRTYPDPPSVERREYELVHRDSHHYLADRLLHYLKWQEWIPDSLLNSQWDHNSLFTLRPLSQEQQAVVDELKTRVATLVAKLASLQLDTIPALMRTDYAYFMKETKELGERMLQTKDYPFSAERHALAVDAWVAMNNVMNMKLFMDTMQPRSSRFHRVATALVRLVWTMVSAVHKDIAKPDDLTTDHMNDFFWMYVSRAYERPPNDDFNTERIEEILKIASEFWGEEEVERIDGPSSPPRRRPRLV